MDMVFGDNGKKAELLFDGKPVREINGIPVLSINGVPTQETLDAWAEAEEWLNSPAVKAYDEWYGKYLEMVNGADA